MSRTDRDKKGGHTSSRWFTNHDNTGWWKRMIRRRVRHHANTLTRQGIEPAPRHPAEGEYYD